MKDKNHINISREAEIYTSTQQRGMNCHRIKAIY
jgi:hypothetical protein